MVFYFSSNVCSPCGKIFMGLDKHENEDLLKWGFPEDVWFHVDALSSAHVYLRLQKGQTLDDIPLSLIQDCAQLVKANSILGNKKNNIDVVYTEWVNLKKTAEMDVGQVSFHNPKQVRVIKVEKRLNDIVNRLNKTKVEKYPCLRSEREERDRQERSEQKEIYLKEKEKAKLTASQKKEEEELKSYSSLMDGTMKSNQDDAEDSDEFM